MVYLINNRQPTKTSRPNKPDILRDPDFDTLCLATSNEQERFEAALRLRNKAERGQLNELSIIYNREISSVIGELIAEAIMKIVEDNHLERQPQTYNFLLGLVLRPDRNPAKTEGPKQTSNVYIKRKAFFLLAKSGSLAILPELCRAYNLTEDRATKEYAAFAILKTIEQNMTVAQSIIQREAVIRATLLQIINNERLPESYRNNSKLLLEQDLKTKRAFFE